MKRFIIMMLTTLALAMAEDVNSEENLEPIVFAAEKINPVAVEQRVITYEDALEEEDEVVTVFVSIFKGWPSKVEIDIDSESGIFY